MKQRLKWIVLGATILLAIAALWQGQRMAHQLRHTETEKIRLWANAISQRKSLVEAMEHFFDEATLDEHRKMEMYANILKSFDDQDVGADMQFSLAYVNYIVDSAKTPLIITTAADSIITVPQEYRGMKLEGELLEEYSLNPPFEYTIWGLHFRLYYKESHYYTQLRDVLDAYMQSFFDDITNNSVFVPVIVIDSTSRQMLAVGNIDTIDIQDSSRLERRLSKMASSNEPIHLQLAGNSVAMVYYENTPLLRSLKLLPLFYLFILFTLLLISYNLFRTTRTMEQNRVWVGLAKETAHQLGTPTSSLMAWMQYLRGKTLTDDYITEIEKDIERLETITHRFSKIGSVPELTQENVGNIINKVVAYLQNRVPRKVHFSVVVSEDEPLMAPLNPYLFEWVIENLCKNAVDAMSGEGTITIVVSQDTRNIYIDVSDTGHGIPASVQRHVFDSGFTTKTRGWGLGLTLARRIIREYHKGKLYIKYSIVGQGTTFRIVLHK